jgi:hypothetical protein
VQQVTDFFVGIALGNELEHAVFAARKRRPRPFRQRQEGAQQRGSDLAGEERLVIGKPILLLQ